MISLDKVYNRVMTSVLPFKEGLGCVVHLLPVWVERPLDDLTRMSTGFKIVIIS